MDNLSISLKAKKITFHKEYLSLTDVQERMYRVAYEDIVFAYLETRSTEPGKEGRLIRPALEDITEDTDGGLVMLDCRHHRWNLQTDLSGRTAGAILRELCICAPYILLGGQAWSEDEEIDFEQAKTMVQIMRECEGVIQ